MSEQNINHTEQLSPLQEAWARKELIKKSQQEFLISALEKGVTKEDLPRLSADAMNAGQIPRIIPLISFRSGDTGYNLLDGIVTPDAFSIQYSGPYGGEVTPSIEFIREPTEEDSFTATFVIIPGNLSKPFDISTLELLDAHIAPPSQTE